MNANALALANVDRSPLPPGPSALKAFQVLSFLSKPWDYLPRCKERYGADFTLKLMPDPFSPTVVVSDPATVAAIYALPPSAIEINETNGIFKIFFDGQNPVLLADGAEHTRKRKLVMPPFHGDRMRALGEEMTEIINDVIDTLPAQFSMRKVASTMTMTVIIRTVLGVRDPKVIAELSSSFEDLIHKSALLLALPWLQVNLGRFSPFGSFLARRDAIRQMLLAQITRRREAGNDGRSDILDLLLAARDEDGQPLSDDELVGELLTLLLAGYETTSLALTWAMHELMKNPACLAALEAKGSTYARACMSEALRMYPIFFLHGRRILKPVGELPAGTVVSISPWLCHRDANAWPEPEAFRPERFLDGKKPAAGTYIPFGGGARRCIGAEFAMFEATIVLSEMARRLSLEAVHADEPMVRYGLEMMPKYGTELRLLHRSPR